MFNLTWWHTLSLMHWVYLAFQAIWENRGTLSLVYSCEMHVEGWKGWARLWVCVCNKRRQCNMFTLITVKPQHLSKRGRDVREKAHKLPHRHNDNLKLPLKSGHVLVLLWTCHLLIGLTGWVVLDLACDCSFGPSVLKGGDSIILKCLYHYNRCY